MGLTPTASLFNPLLALRQAVGRLRRPPPPARGAPVVAVGLTAAPAWRAVRVGSFLAPPPCFCACAAALPQDSGSRAFGWGRSLGG